MGNNHPRWKDWQQAIPLSAMPHDRNDHEIAREGARLIHSARVLLIIRDQVPLSLTELLKSCQVDSFGCGLHPLLEKNARKVAATVEKLIHARLVAYHAEQKMLSTTDHLADVQGSLEFSLRDLCETKEKTHGDLGLAELAGSIEEPECPWFKNDLVHTLNEARECYLHGNYIACLCLCGKILEISLKVTLLRHGIDYGEKDGLGTLLGKLRGGAKSVFLDAALENVGDVINKSRIPAVHFKEEIPIPSQDQAAMVVSATVDTVRRLLTKRSAVCHEFGEFHRPRRNT